MPTTRQELQSIPNEWFDYQLNSIVTDIAREVKYAAKSQSFYEHDVLTRTNNTGVYSTSPRIVLEDVLRGLKREFPDCYVEIERDDEPGRGIRKLVIRIEWGIRESQ